MRSKYLKVWVLVGLVILILIVSCVNVESNRTKDVVGKDVIRTKEVVWVLQRAGLSLKASQSPLLAPGECVLGEVQPKVYDLDMEGLGQLYIYEFDSTLDRKNVLEGIEKMEDDPFSRSQIPSVAYRAKNIVIVLALNISVENWQRDYEKIAPAIQTLAKTIFYDLIQGEQWVLYGEGEHWEAKLVVSSYEESWTGEDGNMMFKLYMYENPMVKYKGNPQEIKDITYSFEYLSGKSTMNGEGYHQGIFDEEQVSFIGGAPLYWGTYGNTTHTVDKNENGKFSVQWNGEAESFELTLKEP